MTAWLPQETLTHCLHYTDNFLWFFLLSECGPPLKILSAIEAGNQTKTLTDHLRWYHLREGGVHLFTLSISCFISEFEIYQWSDNTVKPGSVALHFGWWSYLLHPDQSTNWIFFYYPPVWSVDSAPYSCSVSTAALNLQFQRQTSHFHAGLQMAAMPSQPAWHISAKTMQGSKINCPWHLCLCVAPQSALQNAQFSCCNLPTQSVMDLQHHKTINMANKTWLVNMICLWWNLIWSVQYLKHCRVAAGI